MFPFVQPWQRALPLRKALSANSTSNSFASLAPTATEPTSATDGVIEFMGPTPNYLLVHLIGAGSDNQTVNLRVFAWRKATADSTTDLWIPELLVELAGTLSAFVGVSGKVVADTDRFADAITITTGEGNGTTPTGVSVISSSSDVAGTAKILLNGAPKIQFVTKIGTATNANALYTWY